MPTLLALGMAAAFAAPAPTMETIRLPLAQDSAQYVALHCLAPDSAASAPAQGVLFIHGASFPTLLASGFAFAPGDSWMSHMAKHGYLACGLDFLGFGASSHPHALMAPPQDAPPLDRAPEAAQQIALAVAYLRKTRGLARVHLVAHSWGTIPAAMYTSRFPSTVASLTLFGPVVPVPAAALGKAEPVDVAWWALSARDRYRQLEFTEVLPKGMRLLEPAVDARWTAEFAASAPPEARTPDGDLRIPAGPLADLDAVRAGVYPYERSDVTCPVLAVYGDYDTVSDDAGTAAFLAGFTHSPLKWRLRIDHGTHVMHLEKHRHALYDAVDAFIRSADGLQR